MIVYRSVTGLANVGGFGLGGFSDLRWQVRATLDYAFIERPIGRLGYRFMSIGTGSQALHPDVELI